MRRRWAHGPFLSASAIFGASRAIGPAAQCHRASIGHRIRRRPTRRAFYLLVELGSGISRCAAAENSSISGVNLHVLPAGPIQTNAYLLTAPERGEAVLLDAPDGVWAEVAEILREEQCRLTALWLTHGHWDHMQGGAEVVRQSAVPVSAHPDDRILIETPDVMKKFLGEELDLKPVIVDRWLKGGEQLLALGQSVEVRHVPGHCPGSLLFYFPARRSAFVGDAIFNGKVGRTDLPGGNFSTLEKSIREQIYTLPDETVLYPGHGPATTVATEKQGNPYVHD